MARAAVQRGVSSEQRKAILVLVDLLHGNLPALDGVALFAAGAELALVDVGMTIGALFSHIRKYRFNVALGTGDSLMHTAQWEMGLVVVELRQVADRLPSPESVAVLTWNIQVAVRAPSVGIGLPLPARRNDGGKQQEHEKHVHPNRRNQRSPA